MRFHCGGLVEIINAAVEYFYTTEPSLVEVPTDCLGTVEKLDMLAEIAASSKRGVSFRERLLEDVIAGSSQHVLLTT